MEREYRPKMNLMGQRFGKLVVTGSAESLKRKTRWRCLCDCGTEVVVATVSLRHTGKTSCGCDTAEKHGRVSRTHGMSKTGTYKSWGMMKCRCLTPTYSHYPYYGGRGVTICQEWIDSFEAFLRDMGERPEGLTLDRIDTSKGYFKENCKWSTREEQVDNRRNKVFLEYCGTTMSVKEWAKALGVKRSTLYIAIYQGATLGGFINKRGLVDKATKHLEKP